MDIKRFKKMPVMGILRGIEPNIVEPLFDAVLSSGLETIEIAMNTPNADQIIRKVVEITRGRMTVGAGTVLNMDILQEALAVGATFIVTPTLVPDVTEYCLTNDIPVFPGAFTPSEILNAWKAGAAMVKVFPVKFFGPDYIKEIKGPFDNIELLACGGVTHDNIKEYFSCGAGAIAFGGSVFKKEWLAGKEFSSIEQCIRQYLKEVEKISR